MPLVDAPAAAAEGFTLSHDGSPDLDDPAQVKALGADPWVTLHGSNHALTTATPWAGRVALSAVVEGGQCPGYKIKQSTMDTWCIAGGRVTPYLRKLDKVLGVSVVPKAAAAMLDAWVTCGRLNVAQA